MSLASLRERSIRAWEPFARSSSPVVLVGAGTCGKAAGADDVLAALRSALKDSGVPAAVVETGCIGMCYAEPLVEIGRADGTRALFGGVTPDKARGLVEDFLVQGKARNDLAVASMSPAAEGGPPAFTELPAFRGQVRVAMRNCGVIDPESLEHYVARGGYAGLERALSMEPGEVIAEVKKSGLRGRGGAGFPTGVKWELCRRNESDLRYMICNADEGDPGAFMDRSVLESDPHSVIEGMLIGGWAIGASEGVIYVRHEYPLAVRRLRIAIGQCEAEGLLGESVLGTGFKFRISIMQGAGAFVCGEETALIASIEGKRGMPRPRPPFPAQSGLHGRPTNINNVETLANVPAILEKGADWYAKFGTEKSRGTKTFALAGKVVRTGLIEVPLGITLREIVHGIGGGIPGGKAFKAVQTGGPSGGCIPESMLDLPVDYERLAEAGSIMGSGGMVVMDEDSCMVDIARYFLNFTCSESCGKCAPCRLGTRHLLTILERITSGRGSPADIGLLEELGPAVRSTSLCGLGQTAPNPVLTTLKYFREEYEEHVNSGQCRAFSCQALVRYHISAERCIGCRACARACPVGAITGELKKVHLLDQDKCTRCGSCLLACPPAAAAVFRTSGSLVKMEPQKKKAGKP